MKKENLEIFKQKIFNQVGNDYTVLGNYINSNTKILMRHNFCGYEWETKPVLFNRGRRCPKCSRRIILSEDILKNKLKEKFGSEYELIEFSGYANKNSKFKHNTCGTIFEMRSNNLINIENKCPYCSGKGKWSQNLFEKRLFELTNGEYTLLSEYKNTRTKVKMKHNKCGHEWLVIPKNFISNSVASRCPICSKFISKAEKRIIKFLEENSINFKFDKTIFDSKLRADFTLEDKKTILEFDGMQHFIKKFPSENIEIVRKRDKEKNKLIIKNNYILIRIAYTERSQLEKILEDLILRKKFNDYRNASTIEAYWKQETGIFIHIPDDIVSSA